MLIPWRLKKSEVFKYEGHHVSRKIWKSACNSVPVSSLNVNHIYSGMLLKVKELQTNIRENLNQKGKTTKSENLILLWQKSSEAFTNYLYGSWYRKVFLKSPLFCLRSHRFVLIEVLLTIFSHLTVMWSITAFNDYFSAGKASGEEEWKVGNKWEMRLTNAFAKCPRCKFAQLPVGRNEAWEKQA